MPWLLQADDTTVQPAERPAACRSLRDPIETRSFETKRPASTPVGRGAAQTDPPIPRLAASSAAGKAPVPCANAATCRPASVARNVDRNLAIPCADRFGRGFCPGEVTLVRGHDLDRPGRRRRHNRVAPDFLHALLVNFFCAINRLAGRCPDPDPCNYDRDHHENTEEDLRLDLSETGHLFPPNLSGAPYSMRSRPPMYGRSTSGIVIDPSAF